MHLLQIARDQAAQQASNGVLPSEKQCSKCHQVLQAELLLLDA
jgi:cytochrome c551/c552